METALLCLCMLCLLLLGACLVMVASANKAMKDLALEALLSSRANSAEDAAQAVISVHQAAEDRKQGPEPSSGPVNYGSDNIIQAPDGTVLSILRPR